MSEDTAKAQRSTVVADSCCNYHGILTKEVAVKGLLAEKALLVVLFPMEVSHQSLNLPAFARSDHVSVIRLRRKKHRKAIGCM